MKLCKVLEVELLYYSLCYPIAHFGNLVYDNNNNDIDHDHDHDNNNDNDNNGNHDDDLLFNNC